MGKGTANPRQVVRWIGLGLVLLMTAILVTKFTLVGYNFEAITPQPSFDVKLTMTFEGNGEDLFVRTYLPAARGNQKIPAFRTDDGGLETVQVSDPLNQLTEWRAKASAGKYSVQAIWTARLDSQTFEIPPELTIPASYPKDIQPELLATEKIQSTDPEIGELAARLTQGQTRVLPVLQAVFGYVRNLGAKPFKGTTDALTALRLGEASCNGKSRLMAALLRHSGIPARLVGGLILTPGSKKTSHQWLEAYINGYWVPFDALNNHFAHLPHDYFVLYLGDEALFTHSTDIAFDYRFDITEKTVTNDRLASFLGGHGFNIFQAVEGLVQGGMPLKALLFLFVIPLGVLGVVFARNVIGLTTFGTFLPALMAMAVQQTGLFTGLVAFLTTLVVTAGARSLLERLGLLHTPKLAILMIVVIATLVSLAALTQALGLEVFATMNSAALFPIAILTITSERLAITIEEDGLKKAAWVSLQTLGVISFCYLIMSSVTLQSLMMAFPELLLGVVAMNLWIGTWTGIRVMEFLRFRSLIWEGKNAD